jgi:hypothetical protein
MIYYVAMPFTHVDNGLAVPGPRRPPAAPGSPRLRWHRLASPRRQLAALSWCRNRLPPSFLVLNYRSDREKMSLKACPRSGEAAWSPGRFPAASPFSHPASRIASQLNADPNPVGDKHPQLVSGWPAPRHRERRAHNSPAPA